MLVFVYGTSSNLNHAAFEISKQTNILYELKAILSICMIIAKKVYLKRCDNSIYFNTKGNSLQAKQQ